jgi:hypothetical protein
VIGERAAKAELVLAETVYCRYDAVKVTVLNSAINGILAVWCRAPPQVFFVVNVCSHEKFTISVPNDALARSFFSPKRAKHPPFFQIIRHKEV